MMQRWMSRLSALWRAWSNAAPSQRQQIAAADYLRDQRLWPEAADAYRQILSHDPDLAAIWVQLGNARKESGDIAGAETAYRHALTLAPRSADTHVQLGHALKLQGHRDEAIAAYARAVQVDPGFAPALRELVALDAGPMRDAEIGLGPDMLQGLMAETERMRRALTRMERSLPDIVSLASVAIGNYGLFRQIYRLPPPPSVVARRRWAALVVGADGAIMPALRALAQQNLKPIAVLVATGDQVGASLAGNSGLECPMLQWNGGVLPALSADWLVVLDGRATIVPDGIAWLDWAAAQSGAAAIYADEEWIAPDADDNAADAVPNLKSGFDRHADPGLLDHAMLALPLPIALPHDWSDCRGLIDAVLVATAEGRVAHLARVLLARPGPPPVPRAPQRTRVDPTVGGRICVIIPTRDGAATLRSCIAALRRLAAQPAALDIVVLDNQSHTAATRTFLTEIAASGQAKVEAFDAAFNWSRLNNQGAAVAGAGADILLFLNDDVELLAAGWDDLVRTSLSDPIIGAVGARLRYPDGALQHGGIVFGPNQRCEHEGVGVRSVPAQIAARWHMRRSVGAVTGAFLACRRASFDQLGGFDVTLPIWFGDIDFCLRLRQAGLNILYEPQLIATHHESRTLALDANSPARHAVWRDSCTEMARRWRAAMWTDPGFNPHFIRFGRPFAAIAPPSATTVLAHLLARERPDLGDQHG